MADQDPQRKGKVLGMPRTTGLVVIAIAAVIAGYFIISRFSGASTAGSAADGSAAGFAPSGPVLVEIVSGLQGSQPHVPHRKPHRPRDKHGPPVHWPVPFPPRPR